VAHDLVATVISGDRRGRASARINPNRSSSRIARYLDRLGTPMGFRALLDATTGFLVFQCWYSTKSARRCHMAGVRETLNPPPRNHYKLLPLSFRLRLGLFGCGGAVHGSRGLGCEP
jgi:hypothetical protein